jgi:hypothetical protein
MNANLLLGTVLGLTIGLIGGFLLFGAGEDPAAETGQDLLQSRITELEAELELRPPFEASEARPANRAEAEAAVPVKAPAGELPRTPEALESRVQSLADQYRAHGRRTIETAEIAARSKVERELAEERASREDLERGGTMAWLKGLQRDWTSPWEMLNEPATFGALFVRKTTGQTVDGRSIAPDSKLANGDRVLYPEGKHTLDLSGLNRQDPFPKDILIEGVGMDRTLVRLNNEMRFRGDIHSLTFRDLTIHCGDNYLEAMRGGPYTLRVERCRIIGFDMGAGGSDMLSGSVGAFYASDSRIEACFGRAPGFGNLFDVRGALVARLENCDIVGPFRSVFDTSSRAAQVFDHCRFTNLPRSSKSRFEQQSEKAQFVACSFEYLPEGAPESPREKRKLSELNPDW